MFEGHFALSAKNTGCTLRCCGRVVLRFFLVNDCESRWDPAAVLNFKSVVSDVSDVLVRAARKEYLCLEIVPAYVHRQLGVGICASGKDVSWVREIYTSSQCVVTDQDRFRQEAGCDESPILFVLNKNFRSSARSASVTASGDRGAEEWSIIGFNNTPSGDASFAKRTLLHEILHQFGAVDLYYPERVRLAAERQLGQSVMGLGSSLTIDDLTKVLIGWRRTFTERTMRFLSDTASVTAAEIRKGLDEEWGKMWRGHDAVS